MRTTYLPLRGSSPRHRCLSLPPLAAIAALALLSLPLTPASAASAPSIESESVSHITETDATLEALVNTGDLETTYTFYLHEEGPACLKATPPCMVPERAPIALPSGRLLGSSVPQSVSADLNRAGVTLSAGASYEYWVTATNAAGTAQGKPQSFTANSGAGVEPNPEPGSSTNTEGAAVLRSPIAAPATRPADHRTRHRARRHRRAHRSANR